MNATRTLGAGHPEELKATKDPHVSKMQGFFAALRMTPARRRRQISESRIVTAVLAAPLLFFCLAASAYSQSAKLDLSRIDKLASKASKTADVNLEGPMLQLAAQSMASGKHPHPDDQAAQRMLEHLKGIYVRAYDFSKPGEYSRSDLQSVLRQLRSEGWTSIVKVDKKEQDGRQDTVNISVMKEGGEVVGLAIIAAKPEKLAVVNIVGPIDFSQLSSLSSLGDLGGMMNGLNALTYRGPGPHRAPPPAVPPVPPKNAAPVPPAPPR